MNMRRLLLTALLLTALLLSGGVQPPPLTAQLPSSGLTRRNASQLADEPGTITVEGLLPKPVVVKIPAEVTIYYHSDLQRPLGTMAAGTIVTLVALGDTAYRVRGRARHGDVAGWLKPADVIHPDPNLHANLKKVYDRQIQVQALIAKNEVALGMTQDEVRQSLGKPTRTTRKVTPQGRDDAFEYAVFERVPQTVTGRDAIGRIVQSIVYVKVETGTLSIHFKDDVVDTIEEKKGNPLGNGGIKIVVPPVFVW
jgi:hypothetical protein